MPVSYDISGAIYEETMGKGWAKNLNGIHLWRVSLLKLLGVDRDMV